MELSYYILTFANGKEYIIQDTRVDVEEFKKSFKSTGLLNKIGYIVVRLASDHTDRKFEPISIADHHLFSIQKTNKDMIGSTTRVWRLTE